MKICIQICAEEEWKSTKSILKIKRSGLRQQPFGEYFVRGSGRDEWVFFHSGATKTRAAGACQYAIDRWKPNVIVNLGTCGAVAKDIKLLDIILANKAFQYDVIQRFGKPSRRFERSLKTILPILWIDQNRVLERLKIGTIASADQDLCPKVRKMLQERNVLAADWESASIARICELNKIKCLILRGVSDIPYKTEGSKAAVQERDYKRNTRNIMRDLFLMMRQIRFRRKV